MKVTGLWLQTVVVILSVFIMVGSACVVGALWIQAQIQSSIDKSDDDKTEILEEFRISNLAALAEIQDVLDVVRENENNQAIFNRMIVTRLTSGGVSFAQLVDYLRTLRAAADHAVPSITPLEFDMGPSPGG